MAELPTVRWGIVATGKISGWFVDDILLENWPNKTAHHIVQAVGASSLDKAKSFAESHIASTQSKVQPTLYGSYAEVYQDGDVDCIYIGTPHSFHKQNCLDAIAAGKNVLCEKPFTMNTREAEEVFDAARQKGVYIMEAMWTRFFPTVNKLHHVLHVEQKLGKIYRIFCDFGLDIDIPSLPDDSRYKDPALGAGSVLDIGIYSITWGLMVLSGAVGDMAEDPEVHSAQTVTHGVDVDSSVILSYPNLGRQGICTSTTNYKSNPNFARIEGSKGHIIVRGTTPASPNGFTFYPKDGSKEEDYAFENPGRGFYWEADAVGHDLKAGRKQSEIMPWSETIRMMSIMDGVRRRGGARFPVDDW